MKRMMFMKRMVAMMAVVFSVAMFAACSDDDNSGGGGNQDGGSDSTAVVRVEGVTLNESNITLYPGQTDTLVATITPADAADLTVSWSSSNAEVVSVDTAGVITALTVAEEPVTITVTTTDGGFTATCNVLATIPDGIQPGDYLYRDGTTSSHYLPLDETKALVGVVYYVFEEGETVEPAIADAHKEITEWRGLVIATDIRQQYMQWGQHFNAFANQTLGNWQSITLDVYAKDQYPYADVLATDVMNGYANTMAYIGWNNEGMTAEVEVFGDKGQGSYMEEQPVEVTAVQTIANFNNGLGPWNWPEGVYGSMYYLPSVAELNEIGKNLEVINASLSAAGMETIVTDVNAEPMWSYGYWTSTIATNEYQYNDVACYYNCADGVYDSTACTDSRKTLAVFAF